MTAFTLKIIAAICMCIDHSGAVFSDCTPDFFRWIGRAAMPIFVYLIAEGCAHTKNINKYMLRLGFFALISQIPYCLTLKYPQWMSGDSSVEISFTTSTNTFYTLFLGVACVNVYERFKNETKIIALAAVFPLILLADYFDTDYGSLAVIWIFILYLAGNRGNRLVVFLFGILYKYGFPMLAHLPYRNLPNTMRLMSALLAFVLICFYNGHRGRDIKWVFYWFYPLHLIALLCAKLVYLHNFKIFGG